MEDNTKVNVITIWIEGSIKLRKGLNEDDFNALFLKFIEDNGLEFTGVTENIFDHNFT